MTTAMTPQDIKWPFTTEKVEAAKLEIVMTTAERARMDGIQLLYVFDRNDTKAGGYTVAYRPSQGYVGRNHGKMVDVAVAYCSEGDTFSKKIGRDQAIDNFRKGMFVQVPAMLYGDDELHNCLREMFTWHWNGY